MPTRKSLHKAPYLQNALLRPYYESLQYGASVPAHPRHREIETKLIEVIGDATQQKKSVQQALADALAFANPLLPQTPEAAVTTEEPVAADPDANGDRMPGADEATDGAAPEITTHSEKAFGDGEDLSPEEQAIQIPGAGENGDPARKDFADEDADTAALAEGRAQPPANTRSEPA